MSRRKSSRSGHLPSFEETVRGVPLDEMTRQRYLNYALSVITARALPDVRDGLKPVQRRILFSMYHNHRLTHDRPPIKSAKVVGSVIGEWHPHGDSAVYDAMARMAQPWSLRAPLVDGHGNFGSVDGDPPAAYRYTEARLTPVALDLLSELNKETVPLAPNYDGKSEEPLVLPARFPNLLVNGSTGIAVGMATNIPPHNHGEVVKAAIALIDDRSCSVADLMKYVKGPDFPTGGEILNTRAELREVYESGQGSIRVRGEYQVEPQPHGKTKITITSIPFAIDKSTIVERIGELIAARKVPQLLDVRDDSTTNVCIVLDVQKDADPHVAMAYLFKHTPLQNNFAVNLTCLVPLPDSLSTRPTCLNVKKVLEYFIDFRFRTIKRRYAYDLRVLEQRLHILNGFKIIFDALDQVLTMIRQSDGKRDSAEKLQRQFGLDGTQSEAILDTPIYKLSRVDMKKLLDELVDKQRQAKALKSLLASEPKLWASVKQELQEVATAYADPRRTKIGRHGQAEVDFDPEAYIVKEDAMVTVSVDGWIRRVSVIKDVSKARVREGDRLMMVLGGGTVESILFFSNYGTAYTIRIGDIPPARSGYGDPVQKFFRFKDGERVIAAYSLDPRMIASFFANGFSSSTGSLPLFERTRQDVMNLQALAVTSAGMGVRFELHSFQEPSTRLGRKYIRLKEGEDVVGVGWCSAFTEEDLVAVASQRGRALLCKAGELPLLAGPGRGVRVLKLQEDDRVQAFGLLKGKKDQLVVLKEDGARLFLSAKKYQVVGRGGKGYVVCKRGLIKGTEDPDIAIPVFREDEGNPSHNQS